ncbi:hypothetical protein VNO78_35134 [Psophocarpus tetragonolobus]|uniref:Uncharacterized protein n=1 Tax=Psophocarpus tetragonolobus TaxID=3891 RepID=A0AAN9NRZ8_PSOTE
MTLRRSYCSIRYGFIKAYEKEKDAKISPPSIKDRKMHSPKGSSFKESPSLVHTHVWGTSELHVHIFVSLFQFGIAAEVSWCKNGLNSPERVVLFFLKLGSVVRRPRKCLTLEASSSDMGSLKIESKIIDLGYLGSQFTWRGQKSPRFSRVY